MSVMSTRCSLESRAFPLICLALVILSITTKLVLGLNRHGIIALLDFLIELAMATGLFLLIVSVRASLWTIIETPTNLRLEKDGIVLYDGPPCGPVIVREDRGVMTLRSQSGSEFLFPRRRVFHAVVSRLGNV